MNMISAEHIDEKMCHSCHQDSRATAPSGLNLFREMIGLMTNPTRMVREMADIMMNPASLLTVGERSLSWRPEPGLQSDQTGKIEYPLIARGAVEHVLAFTTDEEIFLKGFPDNPYFSSQGVLVNFQHNQFPGMFSRLSFPIKGVDVGDANRWPAVQPEPFDEP